MQRFNYRAHGYVPSNDALPPLGCLRVTARRCRLSSENYTLHISWIVDRLACVKSARTLLHTTSYQASSLQLGSTEEADELLADLEFQISQDAIHFPIGHAPDVRFAVFEQGQLTIFFRIKNRNEVELLRVLVLEGWQQLAA